MAIAREKLLELYRQMLVLRCFEENVAQAYRSGQIPGFVHLYIGEEAVAVGVCGHLRPDDWITSTHRGHGHALAKGVPPREVMAELFGRGAGCSGGRGGSMHLYSLKHGLLGTNGIVGPSIINAVGAAYTAAYHGSDQVAVAFFGDGGANTGAFHEGLNLAAIWNLPLVFVCENNLYATETPFVKATAGQSVAGRAAAYGIPGIEIDGQDLLVVYEAAREAVARARAKGGPSLIECRTYRYVGHHEGDPGTDYRTREEIKTWKKRDPIELLRARLLSEGQATESELDGVSAQVNALIADAVNFATQAAWPSLESISAHIFATPI